MSLLKFPEEVHEEIFLRLPAESILSSRCVCKHFYNLLSKPSFIKNHLDRTIQTKNNNPKLLFSYSSRDKPPVIYSIAIDYASISSAPSSTSPSTPPPSSSTSSSEAFLLSHECDGAVLINYPFEPKKIYYIEFLGSSNGLICSRLASTDRADFDKGRWVETDYFGILNPLTKEFKEFMTPWCGYKEPKNRGYDVTYGFGYDRNIDDYKMVIISDYECAGCFKIVVYTVRSDSWSSIQGNVNYSFKRGGKGSHGVFFSRYLHWLGTTTTQKTSSEVIVSFDISSETMIDMPLPDNIVPPLDHFGNVCSNVGLWGDTICVAIIWRSVKIDVWVMQEYGVKESWVKKFTTTEQPWTTYPYWKPLWCYDNGELLVDNQKHLLLYDPRTERVSVVLACDITMDDNRVSYVQNLVSLNCGTYLEKRITDGSVKDYR